MLLKGDHITQLLQQARHGRAAAVDELMDVVYTDLRKAAQRYMKSERSEHTLQPTAIVNEVFLKLFQPEGGEWRSVNIDWQNRAHFLGVAAKVMRRVLVEHGRSKKALKRDGIQICLDEGMVAVPQSCDYYSELDELLHLLARKDARAARVIELKYFGGLNDRETTEVLGIPLAQMRRDWEFARNWLRHRMDLPEKKVSRKSAD